MTEIHNHTEGTTEWLQHHKTYLSWLNREPICATPELLCLRGKPGSGKSVLMKSLMKSRAKLESTNPTSCAAFFFARKGGPKEKTSNGLYRSILYQLMDADPVVRTTMVSNYERKLFSLGPTEGASSPPLSWHTTELKSMLEDVFKAKSTRPTIIFIDSVDECGEAKDAKDVVKFCQEIIRHARTSGVKLNICISSRINLVQSEDSHVLELDQLNAPCIRAYVRTRIESHGTSAKKLAALVEDVTIKSAGIFLWAKLAMDILLDDLDDGRNLKYSQMHLKELPPQLEDIYETMLIRPTVESEQDGYERLRFFQWIIFANRPMRLREWYIIVGMIQYSPPSSFEQWSGSFRNPVDAVEEDCHPMERKPENIQSDRSNRQDQLLKWIQRVSRGLVEVSYPPEKEFTDDASAAAGQGSVLSDFGESRTINVIHTSVRDFFRQSLTFGGLFPVSVTPRSILADRFMIPGVEDENLRRKALVADGNATVLQSCLNYLKLKELDDLVKLRQDHLSLLDKSERDRNDQRRTLGDIANDGIYRSEEIPFSYSAAASQVSSGSRSMAGRLPLFPISKGSNKTLNLPGATLDDQVQNSHRMEDWLEEQLRSNIPDQESGIEQDADTFNRRDSFSERMLEQTSMSGVGSWVDASVKAIVGDIYSLHQYSTDEIFTHASNADLQSHDIDWLMFITLQAWKRIVILRDDVNDDASFLQFCMQAGTLDRLIIPFLERTAYRSEAPEVFIWAMSRRKCDILQGMVSYQVRFLHIDAEKAANAHRSMSTIQEWGQIMHNKDKIVAGQDSSLLRNLLGPEEHQPRHSTTPISRAEAFGVWKSCFDELQRQSKEKLSVSKIRQIFESGGPESPLRIALRVRQSSPDIYPAMIAMGAYRAEDIDKYLALQDKTDKHISDAMADLFRDFRLDLYPRRANMVEYSDEDIADRLERRAASLESIDWDDTSPASSFYTLPAESP